ncbi:hypothetical protein LJC49_10190 [Ruminococcaceae bacterium OttesenSCG-928-I18]|nr:hypothetical protein [Ruminococcaceae bacterium OttesenSCG-928-I18]
MKKTRWMPLLLALVLCASFTGCIGNFYENAGTVDGREISSGLYLGLQYNAYTEGKALLEDEEEDPFKQEIEGVKFEDWVNNRTEELVRKYVCVERMCAEREVVLGEENRGYLEQMTGYWDMVEERYAKNGIGYDTLMRTMTNDMLTDELFLQMYGEEGELAPSEEEMRKEYEEQYAQIEYVMLPFNTVAEEGAESVSKEEEVMAVAEGMVEDLNAGEDLAEVAEEGLKETYEAIDREFTEETVANSITSTYIEFVGKEEDELYPQEFRSQLKEMELDKWDIHNMGNLILVYRRLPTFGDDASFEEVRSTVVESLYRESFDEYLAGIYADYPLSWEPGARWYFRPQKIVEE